MADELGRPADNLDDDNLKAAADLARKRPNGGKNPAAAALNSGAMGPAESGWANTVQQQAASVEQKVQDILNHPAPPPTPPEPPPPPLSDAERAEYEAALARVKELQNRAHGGKPAPEGVPGLLTLRKYRVRLDTVTAKNPVLTAYLRALKKQPDPMGYGPPAEYPDGADVVDAYSEGEAWEKFKKRFCIAKTDRNYSVVEAGSPADEKLFATEDRDAMIAEARVPA